MCLAIYKPAATAADWTAYANGYASNPHSWGFAAIKDGTLVAVHGTSPFEEFRAAFEPYSDCQAIIHFRWATHGNRDLDNCHPFFVADDLAFIHNGIVNIECDVNKAMSDTWHFNELVCKPAHERDRDFFMRNDVQYTNELAHSGSKFVFLREDGTFWIWNQKSGVWETDGHWYSNSGYKASRSYAIGYYKGASYASLESSRDMSPPIQTAAERFRDMAYDHDDLVDRDEKAVLIADPYGSRYDDAELDIDDTHLQQQMEDLLGAGLSGSTVKEVLDVFGTLGIDVLHDIH